MAEKWILVADASRARVFRDAVFLRNEETVKGYDLIQSLEHPESRAKSRDLMSDATGRKPVGPSKGNSYGGPSASRSYGRPGAEPDTDPKAVEAEKFARELAHLLESKLNEHSYDSLVVAAPPHFLGLLKQTVNKQVANRVQLWLNKDLTKLEKQELETHVREHLRAG